MPITRRNFLKNLALAGLAPSLLLPRKSWAATDEIRMAYILSDHHAPFMLLAREWERFDQRYKMCFKPVAEGKLYDFMYEGARLARVQVTSTQKGPDLETLLAQGSLDLGITGTQAIIMSVDRGVGSRLVAPFQTEGNAFIAGKNLKFSSWEEFVRETKGTGRQLTIGIPGPDTSPAVIFKDGLAAAGVSFSMNSSDKADVILVNMKGHGNVVPGLVNGVTQALVGAQPFPAMAVHMGAGKLILNLQDLPGGKWKGHSCCSIEAAPAFMAEKRDLLVKALEMLALGAKEAEADKGATARAAAAWLSVDRAVEDMALPSMGYTTDVSPQWTASTRAYIAPMESTGIVTGALKGKRGKDVDSQLFDFGFLNEAKANLKKKGHLA